MQAGSSDTDWNGLIGGQNIDCEAGTQFQYLIIVDEQETRKKLSDLHARLFPMDERRQSLRWKGTLSCCFRWGEEYSTGQIRDLSFEGAHVQDSPKMPRTGDEIELTLRPEREKVTLRAQVIHVGDFHFGVRFLGARAENLRFLKPFFRL